VRTRGCIRFIKVSINNGRGDYENKMMFSVQRRQVRQVGTNVQRMLLGVQINNAPPAATARMPQAADHIQALDREAVNELAAPVVAPAAAPPNC
jgi:hypothetical protein